VAVIHSLLQLSLIVQRNSDSLILKHSTVQSIAFCMRKNAPTTFQFQKSFPGWYPRTPATGRGRTSPGLSPSMLYGCGKRPGCWDPCALRTCYVVAVHISHILQCTDSMIKMDQKSDYLHA